MTRYHPEQWKREAERSAARSRARRESARRRSWPFALTVVIAIAALTAMVALLILLH